MCHHLDSRPPAAPVASSPVAAHGRLDLTATDGAPLAAYLATPTAPNGSSVLVLPDVRGLHPFYEHLTTELAGLGFTALAVDYYGRTAGAPPRGPEFDGMAHLDLLRSAHVDADVDSAAAELRDRTPGPLYTLGFCLGGVHSWRQATRDLDLAGAIGFYGALRFFDAPATDVRAPLLMLLAGQDEATAPAEFDAFAADLDAAGRPYARYVYPGAPHSFFDRSAAEWSDACTDAWRQILAFTGQPSTPGPRQ